MAYNDLLDKRINTDVLTLKSYAKIMDVIFSLEKTIGKSNFSLPEYIAELEYILHSIRDKKNKDVVMEIAKML